MQVRRRVLLRVNESQNQYVRWWQASPKEKEVVPQGKPMDEKTSNNNNQEERMMDASIVVSKAILLENADYQGGALMGL